MKTVLHLIHSRLPTKMPAGTLSSPSCVTAARQQRIYGLGFPAMAVGTGTTTRLAPGSGHRHPTMPQPALTLLCLSPINPSSHTFPHLSRAEPGLHINSART